MPTSSKSQPYVDDPDNVSFIELVDRISAFNITQAEIAQRLDISEGQLSRVQSGERHAAKNHINTLRTYLRELRKKHERRQGESAPSPAGCSLFSIDHSVLRRLSVQESVEAFRDLLWARALASGVSTTLVNISLDTDQPDGGVDGSISDSDLPSIQNDDLLGTGTRFQIKTGDFAPWRESTIAKELFGATAAAFENLGSGIQRMLREGKRFVVVCFGVDPVDEKRRTAERHLRTAFQKCGFPDAKVEVWGQSHLVGLFRDYPSLCLRLRGYDHHGFRPLDSWSRDADMRPDAQYSAEQQHLIDELRNELRSGSVGHLRLIGEPGIGKTRLALEIARTKDLAPVTIYVSGGRTLLESSFINELLQSDDHRFVVLVVDECSNKDCADIWNVVKPRCSRVRLITIDHGPDNSADDKTRIETIERLGSNEIAAILESYGIDRNDATRWAEFCEGSPRVAHVIGENLRMNRTDLLQRPTNVDVWERFIVGHDDPHSNDVEQRTLVLRHVALFERFGYEAPVQDEARYIAKLVQECDPTLTWPKFQEIVHALRQRRILQGVKTLYVTPRALQIYLFCQFWEIHGSSFDIADALTALPGEMWNWFAQTLRFAHNREQAKRAVDNLLEGEELFPTGEFPAEDKYGKLINVLCETSQQTALRCLQRTIGQMGLDRLQKVDAPRQHVVWALEKIAVWEDCFDGAARVLLKLAEAENASNANNATGTFTQLFSLIPSFTTTQAPPARRLVVLHDALDSSSTEQRRLGLAACASALDTSLTFRTVGPEHQGLRKTIEFWMPTTNGELWEAHRDVWQLLTGKLESWCGEDRRQLINTIIKSSWSTIHIPPLTQNVLDTLKVVASDPYANLGAINEFAKRHYRNKESKLPGEVKHQLLLLAESLVGTDFASQLRRFVKFASWEDSFDDDHNRSNLIDKKIEALAVEAVRNPELLRKELAWLICEDSSPAYCFGLHLSTHDPELELYCDILAEYALQHPKASPLFLNGYLAAICRRDVDRWESIVLDLAENAATADRFSDFVIASGMSERVAKRVIEQCRRGAQSRERLERWWFDAQLHTLSVDTICELIAVQLEGGTGQLWSNAVQMCHTYFLEKNSEKPLPEDFTFRLLTHELMADGRVAHEAAYYWSNLAKAFRRQYPERTWDLFHGVLGMGAREWSVLGDLNSYGDGVLTEILREDPTTAFRHIADFQNESDDAHSYSIHRWLSRSARHTIGDDAPGPIQFIPATTLFTWVDEDLEERADWLIRVLPKTLDGSVAGRMTRDFVARYGNDRRIRSSLYAHFHTGGWCGNASDHYRKLRDEARSWLVDEENSTVILWVQDYIDGLNAYIEHSEMKEEREF